MKTRLLGLVCYVAVALATLGADKVLILDATVYGGANSLEGQAVTALGLGYQIDVVTPATWAAMSTPDFQQYRAIILGDPSCGSVSALNAAVANRSVWSQAVDGNIIIIGTDPTVHPPGGTVMINNGIRFALDQTGYTAGPHTGLYLCLSCYYWSAGSTPVDVLDPVQFGVFQTISAGPCYNNAHIVATHPALADLTDTILSDWGCSVHEGFLTWPQTGPNAFLTLAIAEGAGTSYTGPDSSVGLPYILARGQGLVPSTNRLTLTPGTASNPTNTSHTVCAKVITNGVIAVGIEVDFSVTTGPNAGTTGSATTDGTGVACFTYDGTGGVGVDTITAQAVDSQSQALASSKASKTWFDPCGSSPLQASISVICDSNTALVTFNEFVTAATATDISNYMLDSGLTVIDASFAPGSQQAVWLTADQSFVSGTTYTLQISDVQNLCGRFLAPNPTTLTFHCQTLCPHFRCPSNIVAQCDGPGGTMVHYDVYVDPVCTNSPPLCIPPSDSLFSPGPTTVTCSISGTNSFGSGSNGCSFTVTVTDPLPPLIQCPSNIAVFSCTNIPVDYTATATDNCCLASVVCVPPSHHPFQPGTITTVHCVATDCSGNTAPCDFTVTVVAGDCPTNRCVVICPTNKTIPCASNLVFDLPTVVSPCCDSNYSIAIFGNDTTTNPGGCAQATTRTWVIIDCSGQSNLCRQTITMSPPSGYTINLLPGNNLIANQLDNPAGNSAAVLFPNPNGNRDGDALAFWRCAIGYLIYFFDSTSPTGFSDQSGLPIAAPTLSPGQGAVYVNITGPQTVSFTGAPRCPTPAAPLCPCGTFSLVSYELDCLGTYENITGLPPDDGAKVMRWNGSGFDTYTFSNGAWAPSRPVLNVGESAFLLVPCVTNPPCCGPGLGAQTIQWLQLPLSGTAVSDPSGTNPDGSWIVTNLPCYGRVLVTQNCPDQVLWFLNPNMANVPKAHGGFQDMQTGYGPYSWGTGSWLDLYASSDISYTVNFYFLDGPPNYCTLFLGVAGLGQSTTATVSQPVTFRGEYDLDATAPGGNGYPSAYTTLDGNYGASVPGTTGTVAGSAYGHGSSYGDPVNTGWSLLQPATHLRTTSLPTGTGAGWPGPMTQVPYLSLAVAQQGGDGIGFTVGYVCCTNSATNCLQIQCSPDKTVPCGTNWDFDAPTNIVDDCCTNYSLAFTTVTNSGPCPLSVTRTWTVTDACGHTANCSQTATVVDTSPPVFDCLLTQQNLVPNPGFETYSLCPTSFSYLNLATPWFQPTEATPDFFHACSSPSEAGVPDNFAGSQAPHGGQGYAGGFMSVPGYHAIGYREYLETPLLAPLVSGKSYRVSFYVCLSKTSRYALDNLGAFFSPGPLEDYTLQYAFQLVPQVRNPAGSFLTSTNNWMLIQGTFTAAGGEDHLTIGDFYDDPHTPLLVIGAGEYTSYYYLDDVEVVENCGAFPATKTVNCDSPWTFDAPTATDDCNGTNVAITILSTVTNGACPQVVTRTWLATDSCNNTATWTQAVTVVDTTLPVLTCGPNKTALCDSAWSFDAPAVTTSCCTNHAVRQFGDDVTTNLGPCSYSTTRTWLYVDCCGHSNFCSQTVTLVNTNPPVITCAGNKSVNCTNLWSFDLPSAYDSCTGSNLTLFILSTVTSNAGPCTQANTRTWGVTNACGHGSATNFILNVDFNSSSSPTESGPPAFSSFNIVGTPATAAVSFGTDPLLTSGTTTISLSTSGGNLDSRDRGIPTDSGSFTLGDLYRDFATTFDNDRTLQIQISGLNPTMRYSFTFYAFDAGVTSLSDTFNNTTTGPQPSSSGVISQTSRSVVSNDQLGLAMDAIADGSGVVTFSETASAGTSPRLNGLQIGVTGFSACSQTVTVTSAPPVITSLPSGGYLGCNPANVPTPSDVRALITTAGGCGLTTNVTFIENGIGCTASRLFMITVNDACGHSVSSNVLYTWTFDTTPPTLHVPANILVTACGSVAVPFTVTATDVCCTNVGIICTPASNSVFSAGTTPVRCVATDCCGNSATNSFTVTVIRDTNAPTVLSCPTNITVCASNGCGVIGNYTNLVVTTDSSGPVSVTQNPLPGLAICANTNIVFTITDACGNSTNRSVRVTLISCCDPPPRNMVLWLTFDETTGATCYNSMGGNNGTRYTGNSFKRSVAKANTTGPTRTFGQYVDNCLCFNGSSNAVIVPDYSALNFTTGNFSMDAWVKWSGDGTILNKTSGSGAQLRGYVWEVDSSGIPSFFMYGGTGFAVAFSSATHLPLNVWTHLAVTVQRNISTGLKFFVNGTVVKALPTTTAGFSVYNTSDLYVGAAPTAAGGLTYVFNGCLDELELFNRALTTNEVNALYQAQAHGKCRPSSSLPLPARICVNSNQVTVAGTICNNGPSAQTFTYSFNTLSAAQAGVAGAVNWPNNSSSYFNPVAATVPVPAHSCVDVHVTITKPSTLNALSWPPNQQQVACYQMNVQNVSTPDNEIISCLGELVLDWSCLTVTGGGNGGIFGSGTVTTNKGNVLGTTTTNISFTIGNPIATPLTLNPQFVVMDASMQPETNLVSLNGLPPGAPVNLSLTLPPFGTTNLSVDVSFTDSQPWTAFYIVLMLDIGSDGVLIPSDSITLRNVNPPTVGPPLFVDTTNGQPAFSWDAVNSDWTLDYILNLNGTNWMPVDAPVLPLPDGSQGVTLQPTNNTRFFRLRQ